MSPIDINELIKILPTLIRENDTVKGAIITALSGVVATKDDIKELIQQMDKRFEVMDKRFTKFEITLNEIKQAIGRPFEQFARNVVMRILNAEGFQNINITSIKLPDITHQMGPGSTEVEIDGLNQNPPIIVEITSILHDQAEIDWFIKKKQFIESYYDKKFRGFFVAASTELTSDQMANITVFLRENNSELINL